jgi:hypothetical protein
MLEQACGCQRKKESKDQYYYEKKVIMAGLLERKHQRVNDIKFLT